jgi:hypothetical protein
MRRRNILRLGLGEAIGGALSPDDSTMAPARAQTVLGWNQLALQALRMQSGMPGTPSPAHTLAILHTCMYNAWAAYDDDARQTPPGVAVRLPRAERSAASKADAMSHAAYLALSALFPLQKPVFDACMARLGLDAARPPAQFSPAGIGLAQAIGMLDAYRRDGALRFATAAPAHAHALTIDPEPTAAGMLETQAAPLHWCRLAHDVSARNAYDDDRDVLLYFVLSNALADAELAGVDGGTAAAEVLRSFTGSDRSGATADGSGMEDPGGACFSSIAAQDGGARARVDMAEGRQVGARVFDKARRYWQGKL